MPISNTGSRYGGVTKTFHWLTALLIFTAFPLGMIAHGLPFENSAQLAQKAWFFSLHKTVGILAFVVALARILWALTQIKPGLLNSTHKLESFAAELAHWLLYIAMVLVPLTGWLAHATSEGFAPILWPLGQSLPLLPKSLALSAFFAGCHGVFGKVLLVTVLAHVAGAFKHLIIDRDKTLQRMLPGPVDLPPVAPHKKSNLPLIAASVIYAAALAFGTVLGLAHQTPQQAEHAPELSKVASQWQVQDGTLSLTIKQFGSDVTGSFSDWTAAISFDQTPDLDGNLGNVDVIVAIPSLTLGTVSDQAMGVDYFNSTTFPTARFQAVITAVPDTYLATGTLTIKDIVVPLTLHFNLSIDGDQAKMTGQTVLDRRSFSIGDNMTDESTLQFAVTMQIDLTATRSAPPLN